KAANLLKVEGEILDAYERCLFHRTVNERDVDALREGWRVLDLVKRALDEPDKDSTRERGDGKVRIGDQVDRLKDEVLVARAIAQCALRLPESIREFCPASGEIENRAATDSNDKKSQGEEVQESQGKEDSTGQGEEDPLQKLGKLLMFESWIYLDPVPLHRRRVRIERGNADIPCLPPYTLDKYLEYFKPEEGSVEKEIDEMLGKLKDRFGVTGQDDLRALLPREMCDYYRVKNETRNQRNHS
ncbi:hypothetical protein D6779_10935, partial [Candidatus Parcubacteria bacterium]